MDFEEWSGTVRKVITERESTTKADTSKAEPAKVEETTAAEEPKNPMRYVCTEDSTRTTDSLDPALIDSVFHDVRKANQKGCINF